ncbi:MAG TPA: bifunctional DNA-formamidopyrimidine glycosylase/DNA-(apurinic or apyrimidinic site) lyase [Actinomycetota bacterium]|nr:bifunctional DNA-formamidopyrimidine glycosylase/DNA-(apurinic or apyrimidinic site) lyase [Actinomycetota bacterium]
MPELPEVEVLRRQLEKEYVGKRIRGADIKTRKYVKEARGDGKRLTKRHVTPKEFERPLQNGKVKAVHRKGKYLSFELDNHNYLVFHLGMSGHLVKATARRPADKHTHVVLHFTQGPELRFFDARRFGECFVTTAEGYADAMAGLGLDAINDQIPWQLFGDMVSTRKAKMKHLLMDQEFMSGLGNIYSDEVLFHAGLPWDRTSDSLTSNEIRRLSRSVAEVLQDAIRHRGTTLSDGEWRDLYDEPGEHQQALTVHGREGEPCRRCRTPIVRIRIGQRSHYFCPQCQSVKMKRVAGPGGVSERTGRKPA